MTEHVPDQAHPAAPADPDRDDLAAVLACIAHVRPQSEPPAPGDDLIRARVIDSVAFIEVLFLLEERSGRAVDLDAAGTETMRTVAGLAEHFFGQGAGLDRA